MIDRNDILTEVRQEQKLRKVLRKLLENYVKEKQNKVLLEEQRFRKIIRSLIKEATSADVPGEQPQRSTGINVLETLLKNIIAIVEEDYKSLTTSQEQRDSFRAHILNAVENSLKPVDIMYNKPDTEEVEEELEEEVEIDIDVDKDKFIPVRDQDIEAETEGEEEEEEEESFEQLSGMNVTGRNFSSITFNKIENQILDSYESLSDEEDRTVFEDYLLTNLKLYFDRFEEELQPTLPEPESPDYEPAAEESEALKL
tara:strand:- start:680 stop:1447 length:768 start_codon:yes stop_codon:yes gene_type:complete